MTSKTGHTPGKLTVSGDEILNEDGGRIGEVSDFDGWRDIPLSVANANAARLVAAWNSCKGIETETLEAIDPGSIKSALSGFGLTLARADAAMVEDRGSST